MSWKNIKTFMIILLLLACIIVGIMLWLGGNRKLYTQESLDQATAMMKQSGITIDSDQLLGSLDGMKLYRFTIPQGYPEKVAEKLMCGNVTDVFTVPDGVEIRTDIGESLFVGSDFSISYSCSDGNGISEADVEALLLPACQTPEFGIQSDYSAQGIGERTYIQTLGSLPIPENQIKCTIVDGKLTSFSGKWCFPDKCSTFSAHLMDYLNIMFTERERVNAEPKKERTVRELQKCYGIETTESKNTFTLVPSLNVIYKDGEQAIHSAVAG